MIRMIDVVTGISFAPARTLRMLWAHPNLNFQGTGTGVRLIAESVERQTQTLRAVFDIARAATYQFVIFPEFSVPLEMVGEIDEFISSSGWATNSIFVGGLAPMSVDQYRTLAVQENVTAETLPAGSTATFVNCFCVWLKSSDRRVKKVLQAKIKPSRPEQATQGMYEGNAVYLFKSDLLNFAFLVCFDCIGIKLTDLIECITRDVQGADTKSLQFLVVLEHNDHPEDVSFLNFAENLIVSGNPKLHTGNHAAVAFVNSAQTKPGRTLLGNHGRSAICYLRRGSWIAPGAAGPLTLSPSTFAIENVCNTLVRTRFREDGPCLHSFTYFIPSFLGPDAGETKYPIQDARCHPIESNGMPSAGKPVAALKKIAGDWLAIAPQSGDARFIGSHEAVTNELMIALTRFKDMVENSSADRLEDAITLLLSGYVDAARPGRYNPDWWQASPDNWVIETHGQAVLELASVCALLGVVSAVEFHGCDHSHTCKVGPFLVTVLDGKGLKTSTQLCDAYMRWMNGMAWGEATGGKMVLILTRVTQMPPHVRAIPVDMSFTTLNEAELQSLPEALRTSDENILDSHTSIIWISAVTLRDALTQNTIASFRSQVQVALGWN